MNLKIDISFFSLKCKPSLLQPLRYKAQTKNLPLNLQQNDWNFKNLQQFSEIDSALTGFKQNLFAFVRENISKQEYSSQSAIKEKQKTYQLLAEAKQCLQRCQYYGLIFRSSELFTSKNGLFNLMKFPQDFKLCMLISELQRSAKTMESIEQITEKQTNFPFIILIQEISIKQLATILKQLKLNMFIPNSQLFQNLLNKLKIQHDENVSLQQNLRKNNLNLDDKENHRVFYQLLIYKSCSDLQGLCHYLSFTKNILLDKKSGALSTDHETWISIYEACLRLYARNAEVRQNSWLEIDQILSTSFADEQFTRFLLGQNFDSFSLASLNFYIKNVTKSEKDKLIVIIQQKIDSLVNSLQVWKFAEDIVEYLDNQCQGGSKEKFFNQIIKLIDAIFVTQDYITENKLRKVDIQRGLSFFIESMCQNLEITQKIFNKNNMRLISQILKNCDPNSNKVQLLYHIFTEFIVNSYEESDELSTYLQENPQIISEIFPLIISLFNSHGYSLPKEFYKLIFHCVNDTLLLDYHIWRGISQLYFIQSFQQTIDMEFFHTDSSAKQKIADNVVQILKEIAISNGREQVYLTECLQSKQSLSSSSLLFFKSFKDELIFNNVLMMSTFFGQFLPLTQVSSFLSQFYSPLITSIKWKSGQNQNLSLLSFVCEQLPIDVLKTTYKLLKEGFCIDWEVLRSIPNQFWYNYLSKESQSKVSAILQEKTFSFQHYQSLHSLRQLQLVLSMINCVFDKLNEHSQKSIKQLKIMYNWGIHYIRQIQPRIYPILVNCVAKQFETKCGKTTRQNLQDFELCSRTKNISVLDLHLSQKYQIYQIFNDFNKIGQAIEHQKTLQVSALMYPYSIASLKKDKHATTQTLSQESILQNIFQAYVLVENSCLQDVLNQECLNQVSKKHIKSLKYFEKANLVLQNLRGILFDQNNQSVQFVKNFMEKPLYKRLVAHLKLLIGKVFIPSIVKVSFSLKEKDEQKNLLNKQKCLQNKFLLLKSASQIINRFDSSFEEHFAQVMLVIEQNCQNQGKSQTLQTERYYPHSSILLKTLQMFIKCVLSNIKVRSFHIFKLIKLYLKQTNCQISAINKVIKFYIDLLFQEFIQKQQYGSFNTQVKNKSITVNNSASRCLILTPKKGKDQISFADRILSPLKRQKISLQDLKIKKALKSSLTPHKSKGQSKGQSEKENSYSPKTSSKVKQETMEQSQQIAPQIKKLLIKKHTLNTVQASCTLSMFLNLFARLNYPSLPSGIQLMLQRENDKIVYLDYLIKLTHLLKQTKNSQISSRDIQILSVDVFGNLSSILKGKTNEEIMHKFIELAKLTLKLTIPAETVIQLPIKLLSQKIFKQNSSRKIGKSQTNMKDISQLLKLVEQFEQEPLAYELSLKSHILKIMPNIKSNLHICNLEYIVGQNKSSVSKKVIETNIKLIESTMGRNSARQFVKKYDKNSYKRQQLTIGINPSALDQINKILTKFGVAYKQLQNQSQQKVIQFYFYFKKVCSIVFYVPELLPYVLKEKISFGNLKMNFLDIILQTLSQTLVVFCQFYILCLKINAGFCRKQDLCTILNQNAFQSKQIDKKLQNVNEKVPLSSCFQIGIKLKLLALSKQNKQSNLNILRALNFTMKQSQPYRLRLYRFIRVNNQQNEELLKKIDEQILDNLLNQVNISAKNEPCSSFVNKAEIMDLCLQNLLSNTMLDYAKMKLDQKLKQTFINSQYSLKCLQSLNNCEISTLKVLEQAQEQKEQKIVSSNDQILIPDGNICSRNLKNVQNQTAIKIRENEKPNLLAFIQCNSQILAIQGQIDEPKFKMTCEMYNFIEFTCDLQPLSVKEISQLKDWLSFSNIESSQTLNKIFLQQMQKSCLKLIGKQSFAFKFEDTVYMNDHQNGQHIEIQAFALSQKSSMSDCCIQQTSFIEDHNEGMIVYSQDDIQDQTENVAQQDNIYQDAINCDGIIDQEQSADENEMDIQISVVQQTHVNRMRCRQNENGDSISQMQEGDQIRQEEQEQIYQIQQGTDGSIQFMPSIKTIQNLGEMQIAAQQVSQQDLNQRPENQQSPQIYINSQPRQFHYTIDNFTTQASNNFIHNNESLVDTISLQVLNSSEPVTKQSIMGLIEEYTLNPQILRIIKLKLKKISNSELKKIHPITHGELKQQIQRQMRCRGLFLSLNTSKFQSLNEGSLFSISRLVNQSFQIDQSKFYASNFKRCQKKVQEIKKIELIPFITFKQWVQFIYLYLVKIKQKDLKEKKMGQKTLLEMKNLNQLLVKLLLKKQNLLLFLEVVLNLFSLKKTEQTAAFFGNHFPQFNQKSDANDQQFFRQLPNVILNQLISKLIVNRIGLPVIFKGKWNYQTKKLIRYQFQCLISDSNLNNNKVQGEPLLEVFLRKAIGLTLYQDQSNLQQKRKIETQPFIKSLTEYFKNVSNFHTNDFPYYSIQDTVKLSFSDKNHNFLPMNDRPKISFAKKSTVKLTQCLLSTMKASLSENLTQYQEILCLMNFLDFQTFSQFLEILIQNHKSLCEKILDKELSVIKRFKKTVHNQNMKTQKLAQIYWHMRKSSKNCISTESEEQELSFFAKVISIISSSIFPKFKQSIFKFGYSKEEIKRKQKISYLNKLLMNPSLENKYKAIKDQIAQNQKEFILWKSIKITQILKEDILPIIEKISSSFNQSIKKWEQLFGELEQVFGTERQEKYVLYKQCSQFYKIFLSLEMLLQEQETALMRSMSSLKTKPSLQSTREMNTTGRRRSSLKLPRVSLALPLPCPTTFKSVLKKISPKFSFFSKMIDEKCPQLKIHAKYSNLESKLRLLHQKNKEGQMTIQVKRKSIWQDTLPYLNEQFALKNVKIKIGDQLGLDYGGVRRQWITLIVKQLVNPNLGLFQLSANGLSFQPSSKSHLIPNHLYHFHKFGILVGKALKQNWLLEINFTKSFLKHLLGFTLYVQDLQDIDPQTTKGLLWILNNEVGDGDLGIDFTHQFDILGKKQNVQLIQNGKDVFVNEQNKKDYVKRLASFKMTENIRQQAKAFMIGVQKVVPYETLKLFSYKQLGIYLAGMPTVDVSEMKKYTRYESFSQQHQTIKWFWQTLETYTEQQKADFLFFLTGSYKVPYGGFKQNPISINKMPASKDYLPVAHTCFSVIDLPEYTSKEKQALSLRTSIQQGKGFSVS